MSNTFWGENFCGFKEICVILLGVWFGGKAEEHNARVRKDWVKQDRTPPRFLSASRDQNLSEALQSSLGVPLHPGSSCIPKPKALCSGRMGIWPVYQKRSWFLSLSTGLSLLLSHHCLSSEARKVAILQRLEILVCDQSHWNWAIISGPQA